MRKLILAISALFLPIMAHADPVTAVVAVVAGVAAGGAAVALGAAVATAIAIGIGVASAYEAYAVSQLATSSASTSTQTENKQLIQDSRAARRVIYGETYLSGVLLFAEEQTGDTKNDDGYYDEWLYLAIGFADHEVSEVEELYLNDDEISTYGDNAVYAIHNNDSGGDSYLVANAPSWQSDMIGDGCLWIRYGLLFDSTLFSGGIPTPRILVKGSLIWDPRTDTTVYSNNAALVILDFFITWRGISKDRIITDGYGSFIDAANLCDETVTNADGSTSPRYTINGAFKFTEKPSTVLTGFLDACGGILVRENGMIGLLPAAYYGPATFTITSDDIIDDITLESQPSLSNAINTVKGSYINPDDDYSDTDFPSVSDDDAVASDGGELSSDISLGYVTDVYQAQRLASILLRQSLAGGAMTIPMNLAGLNCRVGRVVQVEIHEIGISGEFRVTEQDSHLSDGVTVTLVSESSDIYDDTVGTEFTTPSKTNISLTNITEPTNLAFDITTVGEVVQGYLTWEIESTISASTDIRFLKASDSTVVGVGSSTGTTFKVNGFVAGSYVAQIRTVALNGRKSDWVALSFTVAVPDTPASVTTNMSNWSIELIPVITGGTPNGTLFEFYYLADDALYTSGTPTYSGTDTERESATLMTTASSYTHSGLTPDRYAHYWIRSVNAYGYSDYIYVQAHTTKEQDLVTTVVERLESIEIVSSNYVEGESGYIINTDGSVEFNDGVFRGTVNFANVTGAVGTQVNSEVFEAGTTLTVGTLTASTTTVVDVFSFTYNRQNFERRFILDFECTPQFSSSTNYVNVFGYDYLVGTTSGVTHIPRITPNTCYSATDSVQFSSIAPAPSYFTNGHYNSTNAITHFDRIFHIKWLATVPASTTEGTDTVTLQINVVNPTTTAGAGFKLQYGVVRADVVKTVDSDDDFTIGYA